MLTDTLANIVYKVRAEAGHSLLASQGQNTIDAIKYLVQRTQIELWTAYQWPTLKVRADTPLDAGQFIYDYPAGASFEQVREAWTSQNNSVSWIPVAYGISENMIAPNGNSSQNGDMPQYWGTERDQFRVWPTPVAPTYTLRFILQQRLNTFIADTDVSTLDSLAITLFTSAEMLARAKAEDAPMKLQKAQKYLLSILGNSISAKRKVSTLGTGAPSSRGSQATPYIDYLPQ